MRFSVAAALIAAGLGAAAAADLPPNPWRLVVQPSSGTPEAIGGYSAGCLSGAQTLEPGPGYIVMRPSRHRNFGHPDLVRFIQGLARRAKKAGFGPLLIGDLSQPRGGPTFSGHASHQTGLDVDIWYWQPRPGTTLSAKRRESLSAPRMVVPVFRRLDRKHWRSKVVSLLKLAALEPRSQRILVNPVIKKEVCRRHRGERWVAKLRPWFGHDDHFHVRLECPEGAKQCKDQEDVPPGDGCDKTLDEWMTPAMRAKAVAQAKNAEPPKMPDLPASCQDVLTR